MKLKLLASASLFALGMAASLSATAADPVKEITLQGIITNSTCTMTVNGGKSVINVGVFKTEEFAGKTNTKVGSVDMPITLANCSDGEKGNLVVQGITSVANNSKNIFVDNDANTVGFMIAQNDDTTIIPNNTGVALNTASKAGEYTFKVGMASTTESPKGGTYSAPILVAYIVE